MVAQQEDSFFNVIRRFRHRHRNGLQLAEVPPVLRVPLLAVLGVFCSAIVGVASSSLFYDNSPTSVSSIPVLGLVVMISSLCLLVVTFWWWNAHLSGERRQRGQQQPKSTPTSPPGGYIVHRWEAYFSLLVLLLLSVLQIVQPTIVVFHQVFHVDLFLKYSPIYLYHQYRTYEAYCRRDSFFICGANHNRSKEISEDDCRMKLDHSIYLQLPTYTKPYRNDGTNDCGVSRLLYGREQQNMPKIFDGLKERMDTDDDEVVYLMIRVIFRLDTLCGNSPINEQIRFIYRSLYLLTNFLERSDAYDMGLLPSPPQNAETIIKNDTIHSTHHIAQIIRIAVNVAATVCLHSYEEEPLPEYTDDYGIREVNSYKLALDGVRNQELYKQNKIMVNVSVTPEAYEIISQHCPLNIETRPALFENILPMVSSVVDMIDPEYPQPRDDAKIKTSISYFENQRRTRGYQNVQQPVTSWALKQPYDSIDECLLRSQYFLITDGCQHHMAKLAKAGYDAVWIHCHFTRFPCSCYSWLSLFLFLEMIIWPFFCNCYCWLKKKLKKRSSQSRSPTSITTATTVAVAATVPTTAHFRFPLQRLVVHVQEQERRDNIKEVREMIWSGLLLEIIAAIFVPIFDASFILYHSILASTFLTLTYFFGVVSTTTTTTAQLDEYGDINRKWL